MLNPQSSAELAEALRCAAARGETIRLGGAFSKDAMGGPLPDGATVISTAAMNRILEYEPGDLTISVEAGLPFRELRSALAAHGQMLPLDPPFAESATVGGVLAANTCGPRRRLYGAARDLVIGMKFVTLEGKLVESGGRVVKNVAGLDTAKLLIGSFGTLAAIAVANFKVVPIPPAERTLLLTGSLDDVTAARRAMLESVLQPAALDLLNPPAAVRLGLPDAFALLMRCGGNAAALDRYSAALPQARAIDDSIWKAVEEFTPSFLAEHAEGAVTRIACLLSRIPDLLRTLEAPLVARAGSGIVYAHFADWRQAAGLGLVEFAPADAKRRLDQWPHPGDDFPVFERLKHLFDPAGLLNPGRLYGRI